MNLHVYGVRFEIYHFTWLLAAANVVLTADTCLDSKGDSNNGAWENLGPLMGQKLHVEDKQMNSSYVIGICTNVLSPERANEYAAVVEMTQDNETIIVGRYNNTELMSGSHWILLEYMDGEPYGRNTCSNSYRHAVIMFVCNHKIEELDTARIIDENLGRQRDCYHLFEIEHCLACISDGCDAFYHRYSAGTIILIGFFSLVGAYLLFGWIYTRFVAGKRGWRQIPNLDFWKEIGRLQAAGCTMVCACSDDDAATVDEYQTLAGTSHSYPVQSNSLLSDDDDEHLLPP